MSFDYETINKEYIVDSNPQSSIEIEYPKFKDIANESLNELNSIIEGYIIREYIRGREMVIEADSDQDLLRRHIEYGSPGYSITITYEFTLVSKDFVSLISNSYYYTGGVHGNYGTIGYNYSLNPLCKIGNFLIFQNGSTLDYISNTCRNYIIEEAKENTGERPNESEYFLDEKPLSPDIENFENFFFDKKGVNFVFNPYKVTAYAYGQHIVPIPYSDLLEHNPNSDILKKLIQTQEFI